MTLSAPVDREPVHTRRYEFQGYRRADGLWDIEGHLTDTKAYDFDNAWRGTIRSGEPVHDMWVRLTIDGAFTVIDIEAVTAAGPFQICPDITPSFAVVKGLRIGRGWRKSINDLLGGRQGCTHHVEMLVAMGTVAYQTLWSSKGGARADALEETKPGFLDTCHALASDGEVVKRFWPKFYTGA